jgi:cytochrome c oxidase subunit I
MQQAQPARPSAISFPKVGMLTSEQWLIGAHIITALAALSIGIFLGPFQIFRRAPMLEWKIPVFSYYYQALTVHGVMNAIFFTTFFIVGFSYFVVTRSLQRDMWSAKLAWAAFWSMLAGILLVLYPLVTNQANVLYTFYPSMVAHPTFYIGLVLLVVGTWMVLANILLTYRDWRREHPGERVPLAVYGTIANFVLWTVATIGVAIEVLVMLLPLSLGLIQYTDPQTARALFWFFGHPLVYFWLLPAYISWYTMLPKQTGSKILSDPLARVAFLMLMVFSIPVGVHHMFTDPGISAMMKGIHTVFTFVVAVPSFLTAFNIGAMLERSGRQRGATGIFDWLWKQDWRDPVIASQLAGMILFIAGGFSGIINASLTLNIALHNTSWIPAHFHMTLAGAVTMTYFGIMYWMLPMIRGRALYSKKVALWQVYTWLAGMAVFGHSYGHAGILGVPRRTDLGAAPYVNPEAVASLNYSAIAGVLLLISSVLLFVNIFGTLFFSKAPNTETAPIETKSDSNAPMWLERWGFWLGVVLLLTLFAWGPVFVETIDLVNGFNTPGYRPESITPLNP